MRVKIIKNHKQYKKGEVVEVSRNVAFGLTDSGIGIISKDIVESEVKTTGVKSGKSIKLRTNKSS